MKNRLAVASAATLTLLTTCVFGPARSEEALTPPPLADGLAFCAAGPGPGGCLRFQGYIYVGPHRAGASALAPDPIGQERPYIHVGGADAR